MVGVADSPPLVARRIQEIRIAKKLSRQQLAERVGTTYLQIYRIETGVTEVAADAVPDFARALEVSVASFYRDRAAS